MPIVTIRQLEGRTVEQKRQVAKEITNTIVKVYKIDADRVTVNFFDMPNYNIAKAGKLFLDLGL
ncbi:MAG: 4-oxalocrotonate tautomerase [Chloroflexi bacterium]|nr:4-oxalocrotonate tautomerase [Chloroflexota bacterium]